MSRDREKVARILADDRAAVESLLAELEGLAMGIAVGRFGFRREEAEDVLAATFETLWKNDRAALRRWEGRAPLRSYLAAIVTRACLMDLRSRRRETALDESSAQRLAAPARGDPVERLAAHALFRKALGRLSDRDRRLIERRFLDECSYERLVEEIGPTYGAVRKAAHIAVRRLAEQMRQLEPGFFQDAGPGGK